MAYKYKIETVVVFYTPQVQPLAIHIHLLMLGGELNNADRPYYDNYDEDGTVTIHNPQQLVRLMENHGWKMTHIEPLAYFDEIDQEIVRAGRTFHIHSVATERYWFRRRQS